MFLKGSMVGWVVGTINGYIYGLTEMGGKCMETSRGNNDG